MFLDRAIFAVFLLKLNLSSTGKTPHFLYNKTQFTYGFSNVYADSGKRKETQFAIICDAKSKETILWAWLQYCSKAHFHIAVQCYKIARIDSESERDNSLSYALLKKIISLYN